MIGLSRALQQHARARRDADPEDPSSALKAMRRTSSSTQSTWFIVKIVSGVMVAIGGKAG